jgi:hypothetical protein
LRKAHIILTVNGIKVNLKHRPYEMPVTVGDVRLYVETTRFWATGFTIAPLPTAEKDVRLSVAHESIYTASLRGQGADVAPVLAKMRIVVG